MVSRDKLFSLQLTLEYLQECSNTILALVWKKEFQYIKFSIILKFFYCNSKFKAFTMKNFCNISYLSKRCVFTCKEHVGSSKFLDGLSWKTWLLTAWRIAVSFAWIKRSGQHSILKLSNLKRNDSSICSYLFLKSWYN